MRIPTLPDRGRFHTSATLVLLCVLLSPARAAAQSPAPVSPDWAIAWRSDLDTLEGALPRLHPDPYHSVDPARFAGALDSLRAAVPGLSHHEIVVELARIVALVGDGHTRLTLPLDTAAGFFQGHSRTPPPHVPGLVFRHYPIRIYLYDDGLFVRRAARRHADLAGLRVVGIGDRSIEEAMSAVEPTVERDNEYQVKHLLPDRLVIPEILHARGVIDGVGAARWTFADETGRHREVLLEPVPVGERVEWVNARAEGPAPLHLRHPDRRYWFEHLADERTVYFRYREVLDEESGEPIHRFAERLFQFIEDHPVERLIIDVRGNPGGNGGLNRPLVHGLIRSTKLWEPGRLFAIIDRGTFSAAMMFAAALEDHTPVIFVGEPTGARPNHYGDSRKLRLPNSGITVRVSTLYWQLTDPRDDRAAIEPHWPVGFRSEDYRRNRDPAVESILALDGGGGADPAGRWVGIWGIERARYDMSLELRRDSSGWSGTLDLPVLDLEDAGLVNLRLSDGWVQFEWDSPQGRFEFVGRVCDEQIVGLAVLRGRRFPFIVHRQTAEVPG